MSFSCASLQHNKTVQNMLDTVSWDVQVPDLETISGLVPYLFVSVFEDEKQCLFTLLRFQARYEYDKVFTLLQANTELIPF